MLFEMIAKIISSLTLAAIAQGQFQTISMLNREVVSGKNNITKVCSEGLKNYFQLFVP